MEGMLLNIMKATYDKLTANIILNGKHLKPFLLKSETRQEDPFSPLLFDIVLKFLTRAIREEQEIKGIYTGKEEVKLSLFVDDMMLYLKDPKNSRNDNTFGKLAGYRINIQKSGVFQYITSMNTLRKKSWK
jgi:hypothetical protein